MSEPTLTQRYLSALAARLPRRDRASRRLLAEIRDHFADSVAAALAEGRPANEAERQTLERLGPASAVADAWKVNRPRALRVQKMTVIFAVVVVSGLGAAQYAAGGRDNRAPELRPESAHAHARCATVAARHGAVGVSKPAQARSAPHRVGSCPSSR
jgi:HAAS